METILEQTDYKIVVLTELENSAHIEVFYLK